MSDAPPTGTPPPGEPPAADRPPKAEEEKTVGELVFEVSEQASVLIREEIELAKTEVSEKVNRLLAGSVAGLVAGVLLIAALILVMHGIAILLGDNVFDGRVWLGYLVEGAAFILVAAASGFYAYRSIRRGAPPTPEMAIEEAKEIRATLEGTEAK
ncbi:MAG: phage holin family protein [Solirubrobacterales bacterium]